MKSRLNPVLVWSADGRYCYRCHRLGKTCGQSPAARKRRVRAPPAPPQPEPQPQPQPLASAQLEEKIDDLVSLLRCQGVGKQCGVTQFTPQSMPLTQASPSTRNGHTSSDGDNISSSTARGAPDVVLDTTNSVVHILRPGSPRAFPSSIHNDISIHNVPDSTAEEQLNTFRRSFLSTFPFVHIPPTTSAVELRQQKPFLWLVIMSLTTKFVSQQFAMEEVIWHIISRRIVAQQIAELDLLLGLVCFASWYVLLVGYFIDEYSLKLTPT